MTRQRSTGSSASRTPFEMALDASLEPASVPSVRLPAVKRVSLRRELSLVDDHVALGFAVRLSQWVLGSIKPDREDSINLVTTMPCGVWNISLSFGHTLFMDDTGRKYSFGNMHFHTVEKTRQCCSETTQVPVRTATGSIGFVFDLTHGQYVVDSLIMGDKFLELLDRYRDMDFVDIVIRLRKLLPGHLRFLG